MGKLKFRRWDILRQLSVFFALCYSSAGLLSCVGDGIGLNPDGSLIGNEDPYSTQIQPIFNRSCTLCHQPGVQGYEQTGGANGGLDLRPGFSYASMINVTTFQKPTVHPTRRLVAGSPDSSYLFHKISKPADQLKDGLAMPLNSSPILPVPDRQTIENWINSGAPGPKVDPNTKFFAKKMNGSANNNFKEN